MPYTPQQNGVAEKRNQTLLEMVRSMMVQANLPISYWGDALLTAPIYLTECPLNQYLPQLMNYGPARNLT